MICSDYSAGLVSQSFWFVEFKRCLLLLKEGNSLDSIKSLVAHDNLFGAPNEYRAKRMCGYLSRRIRHIDSEALELFFSSDLATQKLINLICVIYDDRLFFEFINEVYRDKIILGAEYLETSDARSFFNNKEVQSETVASWTDTTKKRLRSSYINFLTDANLLTADKNKRRITPPLLDIMLERYLEKKGEGMIVKAFTGVY